MIRIPYEQNLIKKVRTIPGKAGICEHVVYLLKIEVYPNCSDMNELGEIASPPKKNKYKNKYLSINL